MGEAITINPLAGNGRLEAFGTSGFRQERTFRQGLVSCRIFPSVRRISEGQNVDSVDP
jgi:hypothetical protein